MSEFTRINKKDSEMLIALKRAYPWLCWALAEGRYKDCAAPSDLESTAQMVHDIIEAANQEANQ